MESTNLHHLQDQPSSVEDSSLLSTPSCYGHGGGTSHSSWTPNITSINAGNFNPNLQEANPRSRALTHKNDIRIPARPLNGSMIQDLGNYHHHWTSSSDADSCLTTNQEFSKINKAENSVAFPKFSEMLNTPLEGYHHVKNNNEHKEMNALNEKLLLKTLFSGDLYSTSSQNYHNFGGGSGVPSRGNFSQIYPSINISNLNHSSSTNSTPISTSSLDIMSTQPLDLLTSGLSHRSQDHHGLIDSTDNLSFRLHHMQHPSDRSSGNSSNNPSYFTNGPAETKRPCTLMESKASQSQTASKKSRLESRPSCSPIKVRKEKLGDRIAALQQLVAPFGKTDTASVLMEAIGYIKFLQGQVETLSVPYMKSSQNQNNRVMHGGSAISEANGEPKQDLRSRGLCLVPLSCMSYIAGDGNSSELWQQPNFGGAT